ncbi:MAG: tRNA (adenosine(37)-N6)-dimethylallyltransferase, partial [Gaiellaceae bacterium]
MMADDRASLVLAIFGPTASGKTEVAEAIAERVPAELVSADSMQVYRGLPVLTNQPGRPTRLVAIWPLTHEASVGEYQPLAHAAIDEILTAGRTPVVVGGTGLYLRAALGELELPPAPPPGTRERFERLYDRLGPDRAHEALASRDPAAAATVHANDRRRVVRALELAELGSSLAPARSRLWTEETRHRTLIFGLEVPRDVLAERIERRTREMFERGV